MSRATVQMQSEQTYVFEAWNQSLYLVRLYLNLET